MAVTPSNSVTQLLHAAAHGDTLARSDLWDAVLGELRQLARAQLAREGPGCTLQTTSLVNEAYLRLVGDGEVDWENRRHFFAAAAEAMWRIRVDDARERHRQKRGGGQRPEPIRDEPMTWGGDPVQVLVVDEALHKLEQVDPPKAELVKWRHFVGLSVDETAKVLGVAPRTVDSEWRFAKAWLHRELTKGDTSCTTGT